MKAGTSGFVGVALILVGAATAGVPIQDMSTNSLGVEYYGLLRSQKITKEAVRSNERVQIVHLHYSPIQYALITLGIGGSRFSVDEWNDTEFQGNYGFAPSAAVALYSPRFAYDVVSVTAGAQYLYFTSEDDEGYRYRGSVLDPFGGLKFSAGRYLDIEAGVRGHFLLGKMQDDNENESAFGNVYDLRGYFSITAHSPATGAYLAFNGDASEDISPTWRNGPKEGSLGIALGVVLRSHGFAARKPEERDNKYFPAYKDMRKQQEEMEKEIE
jgi:hypothetical protein